MLLLSVGVCQLLNTLEVSSTNLHSTSRISFRRVRRVEYPPSFKNSWDHLNADELGAVEKEDGTHDADSFLNKSLNFLTVSTSSLVVDVLERVLIICAADMFFPIVPYLSLTGLALPQENSFKSVTEADMGRYRLLRDAMAS